MAGTCAIEVRSQNGGRERSWTKEACQSRLRKEGIGWEVDPLKAHKFRNLIGLSEKAFSPSHTQNRYSPRKTETPFLLFVAHR